MREHAVDRPPLGNLARPGKLEVWIIGRTGDLFRPGRSPDAGDGKCHEVARQPFELPLDGWRDVRESAWRPGMQGIKVVWDIDQNFGAMSHPQPQSGVGQVENSRTALVRPVDTILCLQTSGRDDGTRIGHVGTIGVYLTGDVGAALGGESLTDPSHDNQYCRCDRSKTANRQDRREDHPPAPLLRMTGETGRRLTSLRGSVRRDARRS